MNVSLISQDFYPLKGGIATYLLQIKENYFSNDQFEAIVPKEIFNGKKNDFSKFPIKKFNFKPFSLPHKREKENNQILNYLKISKPDLILFGYLRSHPEVALEYKKINPKVKFGLVLHAKEAFLENSLIKKTHNKGMQKGYSKEEIIFYKEILNSADFLLTVSNFTKKLLKKQGIRNKFFVVSPLLKKPKKKIVIKKRTQENFILLSTGRLIKRKGQEKVINSIVNLKKLIPKIKYYIVGSGPEEKKLKRIVKMKKLEANVIFLGDVPNLILIKYYSLCDVFVLPTSHICPNDVEGFGIVFLEANLYGKPVIGGKTGGVVEAIENKKSGFLINPNSQKELEDKIYWFYKNPNKSKKMGEYGRKRVQKKFMENKNNHFINYLRKLEIQKNI